MARQACRLSVTPLILRERAAQAARFASYMAGDISLLSGVAGPVRQGKSLSRRTARGPL
jgi:hypothetical protein